MCCVGGWCACDACAGGLGKAEEGEAVFQHRPSPPPPQRGRGWGSAARGPALSTPAGPAVAGALCPLPGPMVVLPSLWLPWPVPPHVVRPSKPSRRHGASKGPETSRALSPWWGLLSLKWSPRAQGGLSCARAVTAATQTQTQPHPPGHVTALRGPRDLGVPGLNIPTNVTATAQLGPCAHPASRVRIPRPGSGPGLQPSPTSGPAGMQPPHCPACRGAWLREPRG